MQWDSDSQAGWQCRSCDWGVSSTKLVMTSKKPCRNLPAIPALTHSFSVATGMLAPNLNNAHNKHLRGSVKYGWIGTARGAVATFAVPAYSRVLVSLLCSYENVGTANVTLRRAVADDEASGRSANALLAAPVPNAPLALDMQWEQHSSQQCFAEVGTSGAGVHLLIVAVTSDGKGSERRGSNQVKVMGVYHQPLREGGLEGGDERFGRYAHFQPGLLASVGS